MQQDHYLRINSALPLINDPVSGHNRWHPDIPSVMTVAPGELVTIETRDGLDGQVEETGASGAPVFDMNPFRPHPLTGPIAVAGAEPGDLLSIEVVDIVPNSFGFTCVRPGGGLLGDEIFETFVARWRIEGEFARSNDIPGIAVRGAPFVGVMGVAPSMARLRMFTAREGELAARGGRAHLPDRKYAIPSEGAAAVEGLRTIPPREIGGNLDIKHLRTGAILTLPVDVPGALFSAGDVHFAQGNGEICSQAIELAGQITIRFTLTKKSEVRWRPQFPTIIAKQDGDNRQSEKFITTGLPIDTDGRNYDMDLRLCARAALREMMAYLMLERGYSKSQAYVICSVAVDLEISEVVNGSNGLVAAVLPMNIFE